MSGITISELSHLFRLRLAIARFGEMDAARWWNSKTLGKLGPLAFRRGFPRSHYFAQARAAFAIATQRCKETFDPPSCMTLWHLPAEIEIDFESQWPLWVRDFDAWKPFFAQIENVSHHDLLQWMLELQLVEEKDLEFPRSLKRAADNRAVPINGVYTPSKEIFNTLALGFFRSEPGQLAVPYARLEV
jgi:hypothetical protein